MGPGLAELCLPGLGGQSSSPLPQAATEAGTGGVGARVAVLGAQVVVEAGTSGGSGPGVPAPAHQESHPERCLSSVLGSPQDDPAKPG